MKKALLILLMLLLPLQSAIAAERGFTHLMRGSNEHGLSLVAQHLAEHAGSVPHHHDDDDEDADAGSEAHVDNSPQSLQHLADYEHGCAMNLLLLPAAAPLPLAVSLRLPPIVAVDTYSDRTTLPLLRPPRLPA
jgi:hypothetical protein